MSAQPSVLKFLNRCADVAEQASLRRRTKGQFMSRLGRYLGAVVAVAMLATSTTLLVGVTEAGAAGPCGASYLANGNFTSGSNGLAGWSTGYNIGDPHAGAGVRRMRTGSKLSTVSPGFHTYYTHSDRGVYQLTDFGPAIDGQILVVNPASSGAPTILEQTINVTSGREYEFSMFVRQLSNSGNIQMEVDGLVVAPVTYNWTNFPKDQWVWVTARFTALSSNPVLKIRETTGPGLGDFAISNVEVDDACDLSKRELSGPYRTSIGFAEDPVNTATGSFTDSWTDLQAPSGLFGLSWDRTYDSGGVAGKPSWAYSFSDRITRVYGGAVRLMDSSSRLVMFEPDGSGGFQRAVDYTGRLSTDGTGWKLEYPDGSTKRFDSNGHMVSWSSWDGQVVSATRTDGRLDQLTSSLGPSLTLTYTSGKLAKVAASDGREVIYGYDANGHLDSVDLPDQPPSTLVNDPDGRITEMLDPTGVRTLTNTYYPDGRVQSQTSSTGAETQFTYDDVLLTVTVTDVSTSQAIVHTYDAQGRLVSITDSNGEMLTRGYDSFDQLTASSARGGGATGVTRDGAGLPRQIAQTGSGPIDITYVNDGSLRVETVTDHRGTTTYTYDGAERLPSVVTNGLGHQTSYDVNDTTGLVDSMTDADGVTMLYRYDGLRRLDETEDEIGNITEYGYDAYGHRNYVKLPSGAETSAVFDAAGRLLSTTAADTGQTVYTYDDAGRVETITDPTLAVTEYRYDPVTGLLDQMEDPMNRITSFEYDALGQLEKTNFADGSSSSQVVGDMGRVESVTDEVNRTTLYGYDADGNIVEVTDDEGGVTETFYDSAGRVEWTEDAANRRTTYVYHPVTGLLESETSPAGTITYDYDGLGRQTLVTDLRGGETETKYTPGNRVDWIEDPLDRRTTYGYDDAGRLETVTSPGSLTTTYGYHADGLVNLVRTPEGNETTTIYDGMGRVLTETDPAGVITTNTWTTRGELKTRSTSGAGEVEYNYYPDGTLEWVDDALNDRTSFTYDDRGRLETRTDPAGKEWVTDYNPAGELASEIDPLLRATTYSYDGAGRLETRSDASGRTRTNTWHLDGLLDVQVDSDGTNSRTTDYSYDALGRRIAASDNGQPVKSYSYNAAGDLTAETTRFAGGERTLGFVYDVAGQRTQLQRADGTTVDYHYDAAGRVDVLNAGEVGADSFAGITTGPFDTSKWDVANSGGATALIDTNSGRLTVPTSGVSNAESKAPASADGDTAVTFAFADNATPLKLRVDQRRQSADDFYSLEVVADSGTAAITKTVSGTTTQLATFIVPVTTDPQRLRFEANGSTLSAKVWAAADPEPGIWSATTTDTSITGNGRPGVNVDANAGAGSSVTIDNWLHYDPNTPPITLVDYGWDDDSNLTSEAFADGGTRDWAWTDAQLTGFNQNIPGAVRTTTLGYDTSGRIETDTTGGVTTTYGYDLANQLRTATPTTGPASEWTYNSRGHRLTDTLGADTTTFTYDDAGQLLTATPTTGPATAYAFDGAGRRMSETTGTDVTTYAYNPTGDLSETVLPDGDTTYRFTDPGGGGSVGFEFDTAQIRYRFYDWDNTGGLAELTALADVGYDSLGTVTGHTTGLARTDGAPWAVAQTAASVDALASDVHHSTISSTATDLAAADEYTAWGDTSTSATTTPALGYRGELTIAGLTHLRARDYDPATAQFTSTDPIDGMNGTPVRNSPYHYTNNNPLNLTDPTGLFPTDGKIVCNVSKQAAWLSGHKLWMGEGTCLLVPFGLDPNSNCYDNSWRQNTVNMADGVLKGMIGSDAAEFITPGDQSCSSNPAYSAGNGLGFGLLLNFGLVANAPKAAAAVGTVRAGATRSITPSGLADDGARFVVDSAGATTLRAKAPQGWINVSEHAAQRMTQRGISVAAVDKALTTQSFRYFHDGVWKTGYYDAGSKVFVGTVDGTATTVIKTGQGYINNLKAAGP